MKAIFKILDYLSALFMGTATVLLASMVIDEGWGMLTAMAAGMFAGTAVMLIAVLVFSQFASAFEILAPGTIITMFTGMAAGAAVSMWGAGYKSMLLPASVFSLLVQTGIDLYNMKLKGDVNAED